MAVAVCQVPLMGQERRMLHEKQRRKRSRANIGHDVMAVLPAPHVPHIISSTVTTPCLNQIRPRPANYRKAPVAPPPKSRSAPK
jgi:hypothetical protein